MRTIGYFAAMAALSLVPAGVWAQQNQSGSAAGSAQTASSSSTGNTTAAPQDSLAAAARRAKEQKAAQTKPAKVFTNDNLPTTGVISTVGSTSSSSAGGDNGAATTAPATGQGEKYWRDKFAELNKKLQQDQAELDVDQREMGVTNVQYYSDPVKGMQQGFTRDDINKKTAEIEAKKKAVAADQQAISDAEDDLRKSGGDPGWAR